MRRKRSIPAGIRPYLFFLPAGLVLVAIVMFPLLFSFAASFFDVTLKDMRLVSLRGLGNYSAALRDPNFLTSLLNTVMFVAIVVAVETMIGMALALICSVEVRWIGILRIALIIPTVLAPVVVGLMWRYMLFKGHGVLSYLLSLVNLEPETGILGSALLSKVSIYVTDIWEWSGFMALIFLAGILSIPEELYEAARVDGAKRLQIFWRITIPVLRPTVLVALIIRSMDSFCVYDIIYAITRGGPGMSTTSVSYDIYRTTIRYNELGYGSALSWIVTIIVVLLSLVYIRVAYRKEVL
jgi:multiple sugar transport system permease protein